MNSKTAKTFLIGSYNEINKVRQLLKAQGLRPTQPFVDSTSSNLFFVIVVAEHVDSSDLPESTYVGELSESNELKII